MSNKNSGAVVWDSFPGGEVMNFLFNCFKYSTKEIMGKTQKKEVLWITSNITTIFSLINPMKWLCLIN